MAISLAPLPEELLSAIASHASFPALFNLVLASKQLNRIATTYLYRCITFEESDEEVTYKRLFSLVIALLQHPEHAAYVQHLHIRGLWLPKVEEYTAFENLHPTLRENVESLTGYNDRDLGWDTVEALFFVLIHLVPNLRTLDGSLPEECRMHWEQLFSRRGPGLLPNLREIAFVDDGQNDELVASYERGFFTQSFFFESPKLDSVFIYSFKQLERGRFTDFDQWQKGDSEYMADVMALIQSRFGHDGRSYPSHSFCTGSSPAQHLEILDSHIDSFSLVDLIFAFPVSIPHRIHLQNIDENVSVLLVAPYLCIRP
jgi:hypothetical protein